MAYGFVQDVPANEEMYRQIRDRLGEDRPDGLVAHKQLGRIATSLDDMREALRGLLEVDVYREQIGRRAQEYAAREFTGDVAARYIELLGRHERLGAVAQERRVLQ